MVLELVSFYNMPRYISCYLSCITQQPKVLSINPYSSGLCKFVFNSLHFPNNPCILSFFAKWMRCFVQWSQVNLKLKLSSWLADLCPSLYQPVTWMDLSSVQFSHPVVSDSLRPHESQHARPPCPSPTPGFTQTHVHRVSDAIQPSHPLSSPTPPAPNSFQHQGLFQWVNSSHEVAKVLEFQL